jgi:hypothetical protein
MTRSKSQRLAHAAEDILQDAGQDLRTAGARFVEEAGEAASAGAIALAHAAEEFVEDAAARCRDLTARARREAARRPAVVAVLAGAAMALVGLGLLRRIARP